MYSVRVCVVFSTAKQSMQTFAPWNSPDILGHSSLVTVTTKQLVSSVDVTGPPSASSQKLFETRFKLNQLVCFRE